MGSFVNRLAARALGAMPLAEPKIPARFTSDTPMANWPPFEAASSPAPERISTGRDPAIRSQYTTAALSELTGDDTDAGGPSQATTPLQQVHEPSRFAEPMLRTTREPAFAEPQSLRVPQQELSVPTQTARLEAPNILPVHIGQNSKRDPLFEARASEAVFTPPVSGPGLTPSPGAARSLVQPQPQFQSAMRNSPGPAVRVTIGRVEIRAEIASPPPSSAIRRPKPSTVSLDQFLKQQSAGGR